MLATRLASALPLVLASVLGCGGATTTLVCEPACPSGTRCTESGCILDSPQDSSPAQPDLSSSGCASTCAGATPFCNAGLCVPCLKDGDCPSGQVCQRLGLATACIPGCSDDARCGGASRCCDGQCSDTSANPRHCGGCDTACSFAHATAACMSGVCAMEACQAGWGDCNHDIIDGCEANLTLDAANCGSCGAACHLDHAVAACSNSCYVAACGFGWGDCNGDGGDGCEQSVLADTDNCGGCGNSCPSVPNAQVACINASCALASCSLGFADCDGDRNNGCETAITGDANNCGRCDNICGQAQVCVNGGCTCKDCNIPNARTRCNNNVCVFDRCSPGFADCNKDLKDGCEVALTSDAANCGACGAVCDVATPVCIASMCVSARLHWTLVESSACNAWCGGQGMPFPCAGPAFTCDMQHQNGYAWIYSASQIEPPLTIPGNAYGWVSWFCGLDGGCQGPGPNAGNCVGGGPNTVWQCVFD